MRLVDKISELRLRFPELRVESFLMEALDLRLTQVHSLLQLEVSREHLEAIELGIWAVGLGIPLSRVFGRRFFYNSSFIVSPFVLDPRPETEALVDYVVGLNPTSVLDLGTGSGCILLSIMRETGCRGVGVDISPRAIETAKANAARLGIAADFVVGDFAEDFGRFDVVVSNPPYVNSLAMCDRGAKMDPPISLFDFRRPREDASNKKGAYEVIMRCKNLLPGGRLVLELPLWMVPEIDAVGVELVREIGNDLVMCVLKHPGKIIQ